MLTESQTQRAKELAEQYTNETYAELYFINGYTAALEQGWPRWVKGLYKGDKNYVYYREIGTTHIYTVYPEFMPNVIAGLNISKDQLEYLDESPTPDADADALEGGYSKEDISAGFIEYLKTADSETNRMSGHHARTFLAGANFIQSKPTRPALEGKEKGIESIKFLKEYVDNVISTSRKAREWEDDVILFLTTLTK